MRVLPIVNVNVDRGSLEVTRKNEGVFPPPQSVQVGGRPCQFVEGWKRITNDPFGLSIVAKGYRLLVRVHPFFFRLPGKYDFLKGHRRFRECESKFP